MKAFNFDNFNSVSNSTDGLMLNTFLMRLHQDFSSAEVVESLKKMPGDFKVMIHVVPAGHGSTEALILSAARQEMERTPGASIDYEKVDPHHFIVHFVNSAGALEDRIHPVHKTLDESDEDLEQFVKQEVPTEDMVIAPTELDMSNDDSDLDVYTVNAPLIEVSADDVYHDTISDKRYLNTFDDLIRNYQMISPAEAMRYTNVHKSNSGDRFELWTNLNDIICVVKDNLTNKYWELKS